MKIKCKIWINSSALELKCVFVGLISWVPYPGMVLFLNDCGYEVKYVCGLPETDEIQIRLQGEDPTNFLPNIKEVLKKKMKKRIAISVNCEGHMCGSCVHKFTGRSGMRMRWICNLFRTEYDTGHTGTCLNTKDKKPIRCRACQDATIGD